MAHEQKQILFFSYKRNKLGHLRKRKEVLCAKVHSELPGERQEKGAEREADGARQCEASQVMGKALRFLPRSETRGIVGCG